MNLKRRTIHGLIAILLLSGALAASDFKNVGHSGANFLQIPVEPVGAALGNAYVAGARGVDGLYWNPGAIAFTEGTEVLLSTADWIVDTRVSYAGISRDLGRYGAVGISLTALTMDDMEITTEFEPEGTGRFFSAGDYAAGLTYALALTDRFSFGGTVKYVYEYIWDANAGTVAFDFGSVYRSDFRNLRIGMRMANFGPNMTMGGDPIDGKGDDLVNVTDPDTDPRLDRIGEDFSLPQVFTAGIALDPVRSEEHRLTVMASATDPNDNDTRVNVGGEYGFHEVLILRGGWKGGYDEQGLSAGVGIRLNVSDVRSRLDYGFSDFGILGSIHHLSFRVGF